MAIVYRHLLQTLNKTPYIITRTSVTKPPQAVFIEKLLEDPVVVIDEHDNVDLIGPPDPLSNLRPVIRRRLLNETPSQQRLREAQDDTQAWNQEFWSEHNIRFLKERQEYIDSYQLDGQEKRQLSADEMSEFYKRFLDNNWHTHLKYNAEWYRRNFRLLFLALKVDLEHKFLAVVPKF